MSGVLVARVGQQLRQMRLADHRGESDADRAGDPLGDLAGVDQGLVGERQHSAGVPQQLLADGSQLDTAGRAREQLVAHVSLQRLDLSAQRRLGHVELLGSTPEMELSGDGDERSELGEVEHLA